MDEEIKHLSQKQLYFVCSIRFKSSNYSGNFATNSNLHNKHNRPGIQWYRHSNPKLFSSALQFISRRNIMQGMPFSVSFHYSLCKGYLLAYHEHKSLSISHSTTSRPPNTTDIFTRITGKIEKHHMINICEVNASRCPVACMIMEFISLTITRYKQQKFSNIDGNLAT